MSTQEDPFSGAIPLSAFELALSGFDQEVSLEALALLNAQTNRSREQELRDASMLYQGMLDNALEELVAAYKVLLRAADGKDVKDEAKALVGSWLEGTLLKKIVEGTEPPE